MGYEKLISLAERCAKYAQACGKRSILETKPVGQVDVSKLGVCLSDGSVHFPNNIIRYKTAEEAVLKQHELLMTEFNKPLSEQLEWCISRKGNEIFIGSKYDAAHCDFHPNVSSKGRSDCINPNRIFDSTHTHPFHPEFGGTFPLSNGDIASLILKPLKSQTAINKNGEFCTATIVDINKLMKNCEMALEARIKVNKAIIEYVKLAFMGKDGNRLHELRELKMKSTLSNELKSELETLEREFEKLTIDKFVTEQPENYAKYLHRAYQEILPKYGIKYETNFSNLLKYDA